MATESKITFSRYARVRKAFDADHALTKKLSKNMVNIGKPDRSFEEFPLEISDVTTAIYQSGQDANEMTQKDIIIFATEMLLFNKKQPVVRKMEEAAPEPEPPKKAVEKPAPKRQRPPRAERPKVVKTVKAPKLKASRPRPIRKKEDKTDDKEPATAAIIPAVIAVAPAPVKADAPVAATPVVVQAKNGTLPIRLIRANMPYVVGVAIGGLLEAVNVLLQPYISAGEPEAKDVSDKVNALIDDIHRRTVLPNCAKEEPDHN